MREDANDLLKSLSEYAGIPAIRLDWDDTATCELDGTVLVFSYTDETDELIACAYLGPLPAGPGRGEAVAELMRGNYAWNGTGGGILGLDDRTGQVVLSGRFGADGTAQAFIEWAARLYGVIQHWRSVLPQTDGETAAVHAIRP